jgi:hypothetical protein
MSRVGRRRRTAGFEEARESAQRAAASDLRRSLIRKSKVNILNLINLLRRSICGSIRRKGLAGQMLA